MISKKPLQTVSYAHKKKNDFQWAKDTIDYYIARADFDVMGEGFSGERLTKRAKIKQNRDLYNNIIPEDWFNYVTNPLNTEEDKYKHFPARIRPYPFLRTNLDLLRGEYKRRPFNFMVTNLGEDAYSSYQEYLSGIMRTNLQQLFINELNQMGEETGLESQEVELPPKLEEELGRTYKDAKAVKGQKILNKMMEDLEVKHILGKLFKDWILAGEVVTYKGVKRDNVEYKRFAPENIWYEKSPDVEYIEDAEAVVAVLRPSVSDLVDMFYEDLKKSEIDRAETMSRDDMFMTLSSMYASNTVDLKHVCWKAKTKRIRLTYIDPLTGELQEDIVSEEYPIDKENGEHGETEYHNEVWEGYRLSLPPDPNKEANQDRYVYLGIGPIPVQRNTLHNFSYCKLPYNGKAFAGTDTGENVAPIDFGIPYQKLYIIIYWNLERTIANSKGKIILMDQSVLPDDTEMGMDRFMYNAIAMNFAIINRAKAGADRTFNQYTVLDASLFDSIKQLIDLLDFLESRWDGILGITRQRKGQVQASDSVSGTERSVFQSSVISETTFGEFDHFVKRELQGLLDCSKLAWGDTGKKGLYYKDNVMELLDIDGPELMESELGVFLSDSDEESNTLDFLKSNIQNYIQNGVKPSTTVEIARSKSIEDLRDILRKVEEADIKLAQQQAESEEEARRRTIEIEQQYKEYENFLKKDFMNAEYDRKERIEYIRGDVAIHTYKGTDDVNNNNIPDITEIEKRSIERSQVQENQRSNQAKESIENRKISVKEKEIQSKERIEKLKAETALKNKVVGEK